MRYWTTSDRPVGEQLGYWSEMSSVFTPLTIRVPAHRRGSGIAGRVRMATLRATTCAEFVSETQLTTHGQCEVRRAETEQVFVNLQLRGHCVASQGGRSCVVPPGSFALFDTTSEFRLEYVEDPALKELRMLSFQVPRTSLLPLLTDPHGFTAVPYRTGPAGAASLIGATMVSIWRNIGGLDDHTSDVAESAFTTMLAAGVTGGLLGEPSRDTRDAVLRASLNRYLAANLRTADLSVSAVARRFGISVRKLHGLYEGTERSFARTIMAMRVEGCAHELRVGGNACSMTELASRWGFSDLSHLNRTFRRHWGCLPSEYRGASSDDHAGHAIVRRDVVLPAQAGGIDSRFSATASGS